WYWFMGMFGAGLFVIGHDCGHGTFSNYKWLDIVCGHICHAPLLASYWPWRKSHRLHHLHTNHVTKDKGHPWNVEEDWRDAGWFARNFARFPLSNFIKWQVIYQMFGVPDGSHYWPWSDLFTTPRERVQCAISTAACFLCATVAFVLCDYSVLAWFKYYFVPVLCQGYWLVMITVLQHQDDDTEVYEDGTWTFVRGQLQTIDREYGMGVDTVLHHVTDGHVVHHFFPWKIPHYHLTEATKAIRSLLEEKYPGVYKRRSCYLFVLELIRINVQLEYLIGKGTGLLRYNVHKKECSKIE
ncbi:Fatty acid desaturase family protein, partial [Aphelenchoides avenae]